MYKILGCFIRLVNNNLINFHFFTGTYVKIITYCRTRWNSQAMMVTSIVRMREALEQLRSSSMSDVIPSDEQFQILEEIEPIMDLFKRFSESMSADKVCRLQSVCHYLVNIDGKLKKALHMSENEDVKDFIKLLMAEMERRFPAFGTRNHYYAMGNFLNPFFKGKLVQKYGDLESLKWSLIENHPSRKEFVQQVHQQSHQDSFSEMDEAEKIAAEMSGEGNT